MEAKDALAKVLPYRTKGTVIKGFGRGSKQLGVPTANFPESVVDALPEVFEAGIYYGWASVNCGCISKMVMSVGWNPFYNNTKKSMETYLLHDFEEDFYGSELRVILLGYIRPEQNFPTLDALIEAIHNDIEITKSALDEPDMSSYRHDEYLVVQSGTQNGVHN